MLCLVLWERSRGVNNGVEVTINLTHGVARFLLRRG